MQEKEASLPSEPDASERTGVMLCAVRLPDGTRPARRFRQTDPLRLLFDFVDAKVCCHRRLSRSLLPHPGRVRLSISWGQLGQAGDSQRSWAQHDARSKEFERGTGDSRPAQPQNNHDVAMCSWVEPAKAASCLCLAQHCR